MADLQKLKDSGSKKVFPKNDYIYHEGEPSSEIYIILAGRVGIYLEKTDGSRINLAYLEGGDFFGESSLLEDQPRNTSAIAEEETTVIAIVKNNFQTFVCNPSSMEYKIIYNLSNQANHLYKALREAKGMAPLANKPTTPISTEKTVQTQSTINQELSTPVANPASVNTQNDMLFPAGHKQYHLIAPESYANFICKAQAKCPVCSNSFEGKKQLLSKLQQEKVDYDFRKHFREFEPLWYSLWVCPQCYYTNYYTDFETIPNYKTQAVLTKTTALKEKSDFCYTPSEPWTIDQVFTSFYLALYCADAYGANNQKVGKLWLQLSWLYHDVNDDEMFKMASMKALDHYYKVIYMSDSELPPEHEQQCYLLLGELYLIKGDEKEAARHYRAAFKNNGKDSLNKQAQERLHDLRGN